MNTRGKAFGICLLAMGALFIFLGFQAKMAQQRMDTEGISVPGKVQSAKINRTSKGKKLHYLYVTWEADGTAHTNLPYQVKEAFYETKVKGDGVVFVPDVTVRYVKGDEDDAIIVGGAKDLGGMEWLGYIVTLIGLYVTWKAFRPRPAPPALS